MKTKTEIEKQKKKRKKILPTVCLPLTYFKKIVLDGLILGRKRKIVTSGSIWPYVKINFL